ncbi:hypothetical protein [Streptomyces sp. NPDC002328]|uniref:hypothetical protein n=1 Tax=Streptomyces sp. NPDC002328 TaxID=3364642 RepID=UPI0036869717
MDGDDGDARNDHVIDWLDQAPDLPHLIARVSELVLRLGHDPSDLVVMPRAELDRREMAAYSAGWADVVAEQLPAIRSAYEDRLTAAYLQGQEDARAGRRPRQARRPESEQGGEVIPLPYAQLLRPPPEVTRVEERGLRERSVADGTPVPAPSPSVLSEDDDTGHGDGSTGDFLLSAREVREKLPPASDRRPVVRRNGRPSVPPLDRPGETGTGSGRERGRRTEPGDRSTPEAADPAGAGSPGEERRRLSDRARALADELEGRAGGRRRDEQPGAPGSR